MADDKGAGGFALLTEAEAKRLAEICPPHKIILDGGGISAAANACALGAQSIVTMVIPYTERINDRPHLKAIARQCALEMHEAEKALWVLAQKMGSIGARLGVAIELGGYDQPANSDEASDPGKPV